LTLLQGLSDTMLQHGRHRIIYGVSLVEDLLPYQLGADTEPSYSSVTAATTTAELYVDAHAIDPASARHGHDGSAEFVKIGETSGC
jgi:hypothetical protein